MGARSAGRDGLRNALAPCRLDSLYIEDRDGHAPLYAPVGTSCGRSSSEGAAEDQVGTNTPTSGYPSAGPPLLPIHALG